MRFRLICSQHARPALRVSDARPRMFMRHVNAMLGPTHPAPPPFSQADLLKAIGAHYAGEAIINVPRLLGSLDLILNPAGILTGLTRGVSDMMLLPYKGLSENSIGGLLAGIGQGSVSLVSHVASSTFSSIGGFSSAIAHVIDTATSAAPRPRGPTRGAQAGAASLSGSQSSGVLNAVAAPLTGTLAFVGSVTRSIGVSVRDMAAPGPQWRMPPASRSRLDAAERPRWDADAWAAASGICREACRAQAGGRCDVVPGVVVPVDAVSVGAGSGASGGICSLGGGTAVVLLEARMVALLARSGGGVGRAACMGVVHLEGAQCAVVSEDGGSTVGREELGESALEVELVPVVGSLWKAASGEEGGVEASADPGDSVVMRMRSSEWAVLRGALVACGVLTP